MTVATATSVEIVMFQAESPRTLRWFSALEASARGIGLHVTRSTVYRGRAPWLLLWGPGHPVRAEVMRRHVADGGHAIALDLAYWHRDRKMRISIDAAHPQRWVMRSPLPRERFLSDRMPVDDRWNPCGPVLIAGLGDKARVQYGAATVDRWESDMATACRRRWPERPIVYRKKKPGSAAPRWASQVTVGTDAIDEALRGLSLVITWHSNVAVDAIRMGIPVICQDGAAAAVCPSSLWDTDPTPLPPAVRDQFLGNLAWFQYGADEGRACWRFLQERLA